MSHFYVTEINFLLPEAFLFLSIIILSLSGNYIPVIKNKFNNLNLLCSLGILVLGFTIFLISKFWSPLFDFEEYSVHVFKIISINHISLYCKTISSGFAIFYIIAFQDLISQSKINNLTYIVLILVMVLSCFVMASAFDFILFYFSLEIYSLCFYVLAAARPSSKETSKRIFRLIYYIVINFLTSIVILAGIGSMYYIFSSTNFGFVDIILTREVLLVPFGDFLFKLGIALILFGLHLRVRLWVYILGDYV